MKMNSKEIVHKVMEKTLLEHGLYSSKNQSNGFIWSMRTSVKTAASSLIAGRQNTCV